MTKEKAKIKHSTLCNDYEKGGIQNVDLNKITSMQCSWSIRFFEDDFHDRKVTCNRLGKKFKLYNNIGINNDILPKFLSF